MKEQIRTLELKINLLYDAWQNAMALCRENAARPENISLLESFDKVKAAIQRMAGKEAGEIPEGSGRELETLNQSVLTGIDAFLDRHPLEQDPSNASLALLEKACGSIRPDVKKITDVLKDRDQFISDWAEGKEVPAFQHQLKEVGLTGRKPTFGECMSLKVGFSDPEEVFSRLLWLRGCQSDLTMTRMSTGHEIPEAGLYHDTYVRLVEEIAAAPDDVKLEYTRLFARQRTMLSEAVVNEMNRIKKANPKDVLGTSAVNSLPWNDNFRMILSLNLLGREISSRKLESGEIPGQSFGTMLNSVYRKTVYTNEAVRALVPFNTDRLPDDSKLQAIRSRAAALTASGYKADSVENKLGEIYRKVLSDPAPASPSYQAVRRLLGDLDLTHTNDLTSYRRRLDRLQDAADAYLNSHKGVRWTSVGKERVRMIKELKNLVKPLRDQAAEQELLTRDAMIKKLNASPHSYNDPAYLKKLARLQRTVGTSSISAKLPDFTPEPSTTRKAANKLGHGLYTALLGVSTVTTGGVSMIASLPFQAVNRMNREEITTELNLNRIPGTDKEFEAFDPDQHPKNQEVLSDKRRMPVLYERPIPENPDQAPTVSFMFDQAKEGSSTAFTPFVKNAFGESVDAMGHGLVNMKYTRTDPVSGKPQRYEVTFGFYPKGGFQSFQAASAMALEGLTVPGQLSDDYGHEYSVQRSFTVSNREINKIFLAAQGYEKGGYNYFKRNCSTFVHDMAKTAGLPIDDVMKEATNYGAAVKTGSVGLLLVGQGLSRIGADHMLKKAGRDDLSYQRYGQKMVNIEDVRRLDKRSFNMELKGYTPAHSAESIRNAEDFSLGSMKHLHNITGMNSRSNPNYAFTASRYEAMTLNDSIIKYGEKHHLNLEKEAKNLDNYISTNLTLIGDTIDAALKRDELNKLPENARRQISKADQEKALFEGTAYINDFIKGLDEIYKDTFKKAPELNVPFQHLVSNLTFLKKSYTEAYQKNREEASNEDISTYYSNKAYRNMFDTGRDTTRTLAMMKFGKISYGGTLNGRNLITPFMQALGANIIYESPEAYERDLIELDRIRNKEEKPTSEERTMESKIKHKSELAAEFGKAMLSFTGGRELTEDDYRLVFGELSQKEANVSTTVRVYSTLTPVTCLKNLILEKAFGGTKAYLKETLKDDHQEFMKKLRDIAARHPDFSTDDAREEIFDLTEEFRPKLEKALGDRIADKLEHDPEFAKIKRISLEELKRLNPKEPDMSENDYQTLAEVTVGRDLKDLILSEYMSPLLSETAQDLSAGGNLTPEMKNIVNRLYQAPLLSFSESMSPEMNNYRRALKNVLKQQIEVNEDALSEEYKADQKERKAAIRKPPLDSFKSMVRDSRVDAVAEIRKLNKQGIYDPADPEVLKAVGTLLVMNGLRTAFQEDTFDASKTVSQYELNKKMQEFITDGSLTGFLKNYNQQGRNIVMELAEDKDLKAEAYSHTPLTALEKELLESSVSFMKSRLEKQGVKTLGAFTKEKEPVKASPVNQM